MQQRVAISWTPCRFGGERPWFICSVCANGTYCGRQVTKLYDAGRLFACRHCYRLAYVVDTNRLPVRLGLTAGVICIQSIQTPLDQLRQLGDVQQMRRAYQSVHHPSPAGLVLEIAYYAGVLGNRVASVPFRVAAVRAHGETRMLWRTVKRPWGLRVFSSSKISAREFLALKH
jgi:hypothetical protein